MLERNVSLNRLMDVFNTINPKTIRTIYINYCYSSFEDHERPHHVVVEIGINKYKVKLWDTYAYKTREKYRKIKDKIKDLKLTFNVIETNKEYKKCL